MSYKPGRLGHVNIYVRNAERSRLWYEDLLGLHTYGSFPGFGACIDRTHGGHMFGDMVATIKHIQPSSRRSIWRIL